MKLLDDNELPWAKDYFKETIDDDRFHPFTSGKITDSEGIILETDVCKIYLFPGKKITLWILNFLTREHGTTQPALGLQRTNKYPFYQIHDEGGRYAEVFSNVLGNITLTLTPNPVSEAQSDKPGRKTSK